MSNKELLRGVRTSELIDLVRRYSEAYKKSDAFQTAIKYLISVHPDDDFKKDLLYKELVDALGEDMAKEEIEYLLSNEEIV